MPTALGSLRRLLLAPSFAEVTFRHRNFPGVTSGVAERLEAVPQAVICGFEWGIDGCDQWELERRFHLVDPEHRGFAYEGATMAFTILDAMGRGERTRNLLLGPGQPYIFLAYIGIGFAMARLPRRLWKKVVPDLSGSPYHPTMSWLAVDGYGFDRAYFQTRRFVDAQERIPPYPFAGRPDYFPRAVDQGIGRALWFIHGARVPEVLAAVRRFAPARHPDLLSGVGLAATFAGGAGRDELTALRRQAGEEYPDLAQGVVFAAKARAYAGWAPAHTELAAHCLADLSVAAAADLADRVAIDERDPGPAPAYEAWRQRVRNHFGARADAIG